MWKHFTYYSTEIKIIENRSLQTITYQKKYNLEESDKFLKTKSL